MTIIHHSPLPDVQIPDITITAQLLQRANELADQIAITDGGASSFTFAQLSDHIHRLAGGLQKRGIGPGKAVGLMSPNLPEYAVVFHGVAVAGAAVTTINPTYGAEEVRFQLKDADATLLVTTPMFLDVAREGLDTGCDRLRRNQLVDDIGWMRHVIPLNFVSGWGTPPATDRASRAPNAYAKPPRKTQATLWRRPDVCPCRRCGEVS